MTKVLSELLFTDTYCIPIEVVNDSKSLHDALHSKKNVLEKCLLIDITLLKEFTDNLSITKINYGPSQNQLANVFLKKGASSKKLFNTLSKPVLHFNIIFTILYSVTIAALKLIYSYKILCIGLWHFNTSISLKNNKVFHL